MISVLFVGKVKEFTKEYEAYNETLLDSAQKIPGFIDMQSEMVDDIEITISQWKTEDDVREWARDPTHMKAKKRVQKWYYWYRAKHFTSNQ